MWKQCHVLENPAVPLPHRWRCSYRCRCLQLNLTRVPPTLSSSCRVSRPAPQPKTREPGNWDPASWRNVPCFCESYIRLNFDFVPHKIQCPSSFRARRGRPGSSSSSTSGSPSSLTAAPWRCVIDPEHSHVFSKTCALIQNLDYWHVSPPHCNISLSPPLSVSVSSLSFLSHRGLVPLVPLCASQRGRE